MGGGIAFIGAAHPRVRHCVFINNNSTDKLGGGIGCEYCTDILIDSCVFQQNQGSGLSFDNIDGFRVSGCTFDRNSGYLSAGFFASGCTGGLLEQCTFTGNISGEYGGGLGTSSAEMIVRECLFEGNSANVDGGAIFTFCSSMQFVNTTIRNNICPDSVNVCYFGDYFDESKYCRFDSCTIQNNQGKAALSFFKGDSLSVVNSTITGNGTAIIVTPGRDTAVYTVDARNNWWGATTGPFHSINNPGGTADTVSDNVLFVPWKISNAIYLCHKIEERKFFTVISRPEELLLLIPEIIAGRNTAIFLRLYDTRGRLCGRKRLISCPRLIIDKHSFSEIDSRIARGMYTLVLNSDAGVFSARVCM